MKKYQVTLHGKERARLRGGYDKKRDVVALFRNALLHGKSPADFLPPFSEFLKSKLDRGCQVKVYSGMIFIYKNKTLITCYNIPAKYKNQLKYEKYSKSIRKELREYRNKDLRQQLIQGMRHLVSYCVLLNQHISLDYNIKVDELADECNRLKVLIDELWIRIGNECVESSYIPTTFFTQYLSLTISQFEMLTSNMVGFGASKSSKTKSEMREDAKEYFKLLSTMKKEVEIIENDRLYVNSESVYIKFNPWYIRIMKGNDNYEKI